MSKYIPIFMQNYSSLYFDYLLFLSVSLLVLFEVCQFLEIGCKSFFIMYKKMLLLYEDFSYNTEKSQIICKK